MVHIGSVVAAGVSQVGVSVCVECVYVFVFVCVNAWVGACV